MYTNPCSCGLTEKYMWFTVVYNRIVRYEINEPEVTWSGWLEELEPAELQHHRNNGSIVVFGPNNIVTRQEDKTNDR